MTGWTKLCARLIGGVLAVSAAVAPAAAMDVKMAPGDFVLTHDVNPGRGYFDVMAQSIILHNDEAAPVTLTALQLDLFGAGGEIASMTAPVSVIASQTAEFAGMASQGLGVFFNAQILNEAGLSSVFGDGAALASGALLAPGEAAITTAHYMTARFLPKTFQVTVSYLDGAGAARTRTLALPVRRHDSAIAYKAPLAGSWMISGFPSLTSHHRFIPSNEFALDFFGAGPDGALDKGVKRDPSDDYGFGAPVLAAADGEVVFVLDGEVQNADALSRREGEPIDEARARITRYQMQRFAEDFRAAATGNLVVLRHEKDGAVEYSSYGHLKESSIKVAAGDKVKQGEVIAAVGNTGDSTLTHLHFQVNAGADPIYSRSLPVRFDNAAPRYIGQDPGYFMSFGE